MKNLNLIRKMAWTFHQKTNENYDDLFQEAALAYCEALENFNPENGAKLTTFAWWCMKNHLINWCKKQTKFYKHNQLEEEFPSCIHPTEEMAESFAEKIQDWPEDAQQTIDMVLNSYTQFFGETPDLKRRSETPLERVKSALLRKGWSHKRVRITINQIKSRL